MWPSTDLLDSGQRHSLSLSLSLSLSYMYIYEMAEKPPQQHFEGDSRMGAVITL
jgi:hypothetical protein